MTLIYVNMLYSFMDFINTKVDYEYSGRFCEYCLQVMPLPAGRAAHIKVIFSDEFGQNLNLVIPTQYDGRRHVKSGEHFTFSKRSTYFEY